MEFMEAMQHMESGLKIRRPNWEGYLFLDVDGNIRHAGKKGNDEKFWTLDINKTDWETRNMAANGSEQVKSEKVIIESPEVTQARLESLMDSNAAHIKRLYYLEEIIDGQHKAFKKLHDNNVAEMDETRKALDKIVKNIPRIEKKIDDLAEKFYKSELMELTRSIKKLIDEKTDKKEERKIPILAAQPVVMKPEEAKEMEEVREKYNTRLAMKAKTAVKTVKKGKKD